MKIPTLLISTTLALCTFSQALAFAPSDVPQNHPNYTAITNLLEAGIVQGYPDGTIQPEKKVNRAEALKLVMHSIGMPPYTYITHVYFYDLERGSWYEPYVAAATDHGIIQGYTDGTFRPAQTVTAPELLAMLTKSKNIHVESTVYVAPYSDVDPKVWYAPLFVFSKNRKITPQIASINPTKALSRGEVLEMIYRFRRSMEQEHYTQYTTETGQRSWEDNMYSLPADTHPFAPTVGETEARTYAEEQNVPLPSMYEQPAVTPTEGVNLWPVYNIAQSMQNNINTNPLDQIFGHVQFMNAWNYIENAQKELSRYSTDYMNYTYQYTDINQPGNFIYTGE